jgi:hypothetical protein
MDFVNNMMSKTGLRKGSQSTAEASDPVTEKAEEANPEEVKDG